MANQADIVQGRNVNAFKMQEDVPYPIFCATGCTFNFVNELIGKTDANAGLFRKKRVRISDCSASFSGITKVTNVDGLSVFHFLDEGVRRVEATYVFIFEAEDGTEQTIQMTGIIESINITSNVGDWSTSEMTVQGTGGFTQDPLDPPAQGCEDLFSDWWELPEGEISISGPGENGREFTGHEVHVVARTIVNTPTSGTPGNQEYAYDGTTISWDPLNPSLGERVVVVWSEVVS